MAINTIFRWQNNDSTADLNRRFSSILKKGVASGGAIVPILGTFNVYVNPFEAISNDGMLVVSDSDYSIENIPSNQTTIIAFLAKWIQAGEPILEFVTFEINTFTSLSNKEDYIVLGAIELGVSDTEINYNNISYLLKDQVDKLGRSSFRGFVNSSSNLPSVNNINGDIYCVGGFGGLVEVYAWNEVAWLNITNTLSLQNELTNHRNNAFVNEKHLSDQEKDALIGTVGIPSGSNRFVTNQDTRVPTINQKDALAGSHGSPGSSNKFITEEYPSAEVNYLIFPLAPGTLSLISIGSVYIGKSGITSANTYFSLMNIGIDRGYVNTNGIQPKIVNIFKDSLLSVPLNPAVDADAEGFYTGDLYITVDQVIDTGVRLAFPARKVLKNIDKGFILRKGPNSDYVSGEAVQFIQNIKGRNFDVLIPEDESNFSLRNDVDGLISYLGSNQKISVVADENDFDYFSSDVKLSQNFNKNENIVNQYTYENTSLLSFSYNLVTGVITYSGSPDLSSVVQGNLFRDGLGNLFRVVSKTSNTLTIVDLHSNVKPIYSPNNSIANPEDGSVIINNNPRNILLNEIKAHAHEVIKFDKLIDANEFSFPSGKKAYGVSDGKRMNPRIRFYGAWENYTNQETRESDVRNSSGIGEIQITDYIGSVYLLCKPKPNSPSLDISINNEQVSSVVSVSESGNINSLISSIEGVRYNKILLKGGLDSSKVTTINAKIQSYTSDPLIVYGLEIVSYPDSVTPIVESNGLNIEAGVGFKSAKIIKKSLNEIVSILPINKYGVNYQVVLEKDSNNQPIYNVVSTPVPELDFYPLFPTSDGPISGLDYTISDSNAQIFRVNDLVYLISASGVHIKKITAISGNTFTVDSAPDASIKQFRLMCSIGEDVPDEDYNSIANVYNIVNEFKNGSQTDFSILNSGSLPNRFAIHSDGQTTLSSINGNISEDNKNLTIPVGGNLIANVFGPKFSLDFDNATASTVRIYINGSSQFVLNIPAGKTRKTIYSRGRNTQHIIKIEPVSAPITISDVVIYTINKPAINSSVMVADIDNVAPFTLFISSNPMSIDRSITTGKVFYDAVTYGKVINNPTANATVSLVNDYHGRKLNIGVNTKYKFSFVGEGFELILGSTATDVLVNINGIQWDSITGTVFNGNSTGFNNPPNSVCGMYDMQYGEYEVELYSTTGSFEIFGYSVLSVNGRLRNTYDKIKKIYSPVVDAREFASVNTSLLSYNTGLSAEESTSVTGTTFRANQSAHGFTVLTPIYHDGISWKKAIASDGEKLATYVVVKASTDSFTAAKFGVFTIPSHGLTAGEFYYCSQNTAGTLTNTEPMFGFSNPVLFVEDATKIHIMVHRPTAIGDGNISDSEIGAIVAFPNNVEPGGFLYCDGRAVSRTTYKELFLKCGTRYGIGDGSTTFNLPDLRGQFLRGGVDFTNYSFPNTNVNIATNAINIGTHRFTKNGFKIRISTTGTIFSGLSTTATYYAIIVDSSNIMLATSLANALSGTYIDLTTQGTGTHTIYQYEDPDANLRNASGTGGLSGNNFGSYQSDIYGSHTHIQDSHTHTIPYNVQTYSVNSGISHVGSGVEGYINNPSTSSAIATNQNSGGNETRPQNITVAYFIRYAPKGAVKGQEIPTGLIFPFGGTVATIPSGYLLCDGSSLNRTDFSELFGVIGTAFGAPNATTFNIPDFRGRFLRGVDFTAGNDPDKASRTAMNVGGNTGNNVGSIQADQIVSHSHNIRYPSGGSDPAGPVATWSSPNTRVWTSDGIQATGGNETRPKNAYVNYIIKI